MHKLQISRNPRGNMLVGILVVLAIVLIGGAVLSFVFGAVVTLLRAAIQLGVLVLGFLCVVYLIRIMARKVS